MDGKITEKEMFRRLSCLSHFPGYQSLENIHVNFRKVFLLGLKCKSFLAKAVVLLYKCKYEVVIISLLSICYGLCSQEIMLMTNQCHQ